MFDDLFEGAGDFFEGAWESVSEGAQNALGDWASGAGSQATTTTTATTPAPTTEAQAAAAEAAAPAKNQMMNISTQNLALIGGALLLAVLALK
jgi:hypothetical protein